MERKNYYKFTRNKIKEMVTHTDTHVHAHSIIKYTFLFKMV